MTNDDLCSNLAGLAMQALIINGNADPLRAQDVMKTAYAFALAGVAIKNSLGVVPEQINPPAAVLPLLDVPVKVEEPAKVEPAVQALPEEPIP